jgi:hypothetical protein
VDALYSSAKSLFLDQHDNAGFLTNLTWSIIVVFLSLWIQFFIEPSTMPSMALAVVFGFSLFKSFMTTLLFLAVKPLDLQFYILVLLQCVFKIILGLGLKNYIWDRFCSSAKWKKSFETIAQKKMTRAMKTNFTIVTPLCTKCCMISIVLLEYTQVYYRELNANNSNQISLWQPPFTGGFHQLERISMAAGFFVQVAFHLISNEVIESMISRKVSRLRRQLTTVSILKNNINGGGSHLFKTTSGRMKISLDSNEGTGPFSISRGSKSTDKDDGGDISQVTKPEVMTKIPPRNSNVAIRKSSLNDCGLGAGDLVDVKEASHGKKFKWEEHRATFFHENRIVFVVWTAYLTVEFITRSISVRSV